MSSLAPNVHVLTADAAPVAGGSDATIPVGVSPFAGVVTAVQYIPSATITGAATNNRTLSVVNKGQAGGGSTSVATIGFGNGTNATGFVNTTVPLSGTAANLEVAAGDVLAFASVHVGTGIADPGGEVRVTISRS
jgi:hypothetical protein